jgi:hypothetical protein
MLGQFENNFRQKLEQESQRFNFADLYYRLLSEWTDAKSEPIVASEKKDEGLDGSFEHIQKYNLQNLKDKFSSVGFTPLTTDEVEIDVYLSSLFEDEHAAGLIEKIRRRVALFGSDLKQQLTPFNSAILKSCM